MEIIIEEKTPQHQEENLEPGGLDPFKDFKLPTFTRQPQPPPQKPQQPQLQKPQHPQPRESFKQPSYHQKYQQTYKTQSQTPQPPLQQQPQPQFSYDNILNSLNMKVNDGKLEYTNSLEKTKNKIINHYFQNQTQRPQLQPQQQEQQELQQPEEQNSRPVTREEHQRRLAYYYWQQQEQRKRISQIKSKKMLYPTENIKISQRSLKSLPFHF